MESKGINRAPVLTPIHFGLRNAGGRGGTSRTETGGLCFARGAAGMIIALAEIKSAYKSKEKPERIRKKPGDDRAEEFHLGPEGKREEESERRRK